MKKLKDIKKKYHNMFQAKPDEPGKSDFYIIIPSGQFWNDLTPDEQAEIKQIVTDEGKDLDDYLYEMRKMLPQTPKGH